MTPDPQRLANTYPENILADLSTRQYLNPQRPLEQVLAEAQNELGFCPRAARTALDWLRLDSRRAIGRLRRSELIQLARCIHRFWKQSTNVDAPQSQPV